MFGWFQRLLPQSDDFFALFERHGGSLVAAAEALSALSRGEGDRTLLINTIRDREHDADEVIREVLGAVRRTFLTPFDRGAITALIARMDDTIDEIQAAASAIEMYGITEFEQPMRDMAAAAEQACKLIAEALPLLRDVTRNGVRLHELTGKIVGLEGDVDLLHQSGLKAAFELNRERNDPLAFMVARENYKHLERIADAFEDVANQIDALVIDHA
jgi:uncharacterized protein